LQPLDLALHSGDFGAKPVHVAFDRVCTIIHPISPGEVHLDIVAHPRERVLKPVDSRHNLGPHAGHFGVHASHFGAHGRHLGARVCDVAPQIQDLPGQGIDR